MRPVHERIDGGEFCVVQFDQDGGLDFAGPVDRKDLVSVRCWCTSHNTCGDSCAAFATMVHSDRTFALCRAIDHDKGLGGQVIGVFQTEVAL